MIKPRRTSPDSAPVFQKIAPFFIVLIPVSLILAMGRNTPVYLWVFDFVPGFNFFQAPARLLIWYTIAVSVLAGIGIQIHSLTPQNRKNWRRLLVVGIGILSAGIAGRFALSGRSLTFVNAAITTGILLILAIILILSQPSIKSTTRRRQVWQGAVLLFIAVDLLCFAYPLIPTLPDTIYTSPISTAEYLQTQPTGGRYMMDDDFDYHIKFNEYFRFDTFGPLDIEHWQDFKETLAPNMGIHANLPTTNNDDPLVVAHWQELVDLLKQVDASQKAQLLSLMNVTCFIDDPDRAMWSIINDDAMIAIQRVPNPLPRAYFVSQAQVVETEAKVKEKLRSPYFDPYREVIIMEKGLNLTFQTENTPAATLETVVIKDQSPHRLVLSVDAPTAGLVVLTDTHYPGWQATVDGQPTPIRPANLAFRAVAVEAGTHQIEFLYQPRSFTLGLWISIITLIVVLGIFIGSSIKQKTGEET